MDSPLPVAPAERFWTLSAGVLDRRTTCDSTGPLASPSGLEPELWWMRTTRVSRLHHGDMSTRFASAPPSSRSPRGLLGIGGRGVPTVSHSAIRAAVAAPSHGNVEAPTGIEPATPAFGGRRSSN